MFAEPTLNDFRDNVRWHLAEAMTRARTAIGHMMSEHAGRGILQSSMTYRRKVAAMRLEFDAGTKIALGELKRAVRITKLDRAELRQATLQCLANFAIEAKAVIGGNNVRGVVVVEDLQSLDQHLAFVTRQFDVGFFEPSEPEIPQVHNAINIGAMTASTIQQGSPAANQTVQFSLHIEPARAALDAFETAIQGANISPGALHEIVADVHTIKAQLSKPAPSVTIIQEAGRSLRGVVEGVVGGLLTPAAMAAAATLWSALGLG